MIKIAIADDDQVLVKLFQDYFIKEDHIKCIFLAHSIAELFDNLNYGAKIDYLFLDIDFNGQSSIEHIAKIKKEHRSVEIIIFTQYVNDDNVFKAIFAGASGFLPKSLDLAELKEYIKIVLQDGAAITPQIAKRIINYFRPKAHFVSQKNDKSKKLSSKDLQILELLAGGFGYQAIADRVGLKIDGVRYHIKKIYKILHVNNRAEATALFKDGIL